MTTSVLIIAHNEEKNIGKCLESISTQSLTPDEIVLICHNCSDATARIAESFKNVRSVIHDGPVGVPHARIKGFEEVSGDIVACLDGDGRVHTNWLYNLTRPLVRDKRITLVAGYVILTGSLFARLTSFWQFVVLKKIFRPKINCFAWGSNFACRKRDYESVGGIAPIITLRETLPLHFWAEDFYISLALMQRGRVFFALNAKSYTRLPEWKVNLKTAPIEKWREDNRKLLGYFAKKSLTGR